MKFPVIAACLFLCHGNAAARQEPPPQVRVSIQYFSLAHTDLTDLLSAEAANDTTLHERVIELTKVGRAKMIESSLISCRSGQRAHIESIREEIYPTEYEPPSLPPDRTVSLMQFPGFTSFERAYPAFETRNTGISLEVEAKVISARYIKLRVVPEVVHHLRLQTWTEHTDPWGNADIRFPIYETWKTETTLGLAPGEFTHIAVFTPRRPLPVPFEDARILLFVRADLVGSLADGGQ